MTVWLGALLSACSLFSDLSGLASEDASSSDASAAAPPLDAGGVASDSGPGVGFPPGNEAGPAEGGGVPANLHPQGDFAAGCGDWGAFQGSLQPSVLGHDAAGSCRVCVDQTGVASYFAIDDGGLGGPPEAGATYRATAWVRSAGVNGLVAPSYVTINLRTFERTPAFTTLEQQNETSKTPLQGASWVKLAIQLKVEQARGQLNVFLAAPGAANACFLVDDVRLERVN